MHGIYNFYKLFFQKTRKLDLFFDFFSCQKWHINPEKPPKIRGPKILQNRPKMGAKLMFRSINYSKKIVKKVRKSGFFRNFGLVRFFHFLQKRAFYREQLPFWRPGFWGCPGCVLVTPWSPPGHILGGPQNGLFL